jgi:hypothetical protein
LSALRETCPPVPEDRPAREARCQHASKKKQAKETAKKRAIRKAKEAEALKKLRRQQTIDEVLLAPSPSKTISPSTLVVVAEESEEGEKTEVPASSSTVASAGVRTRGQLASEAQKAQGGASVRAPRSARPAGGAATRPQSAAPGGSGRTGSRPLVPISG